MGEVRKNILNRALLNPITLYSGGVPVAGFAADDLADAVADAGVLAAANSTSVTVVKQGYMSLTGIEIPAGVRVIDAVPFRSQLDRQRIAVRTPAAFVYRIDDGDNYGAAVADAGLTGWWFTANAALPDAVFNNSTNSTPFDYLRRRGIMVSMGITRSLQEIANHLTYNQLVTCVRDGGWEINCHSDTHTTLDGTEANMWDEIIGCKGTMEGLIADATNGFTYDMRAFIAPGTWQSNYYLMTKANQTGIMGQMLQFAYERSQGFSEYPVSTVPPPAHFDTIMASLTYASTDAQIDAAALNCTRAGNITTIYHHQVKDVGSGTTISTVQWKRLVDALYVAIAAGKTTCVPLSQAHLVELNRNRFFGGFRDGQWEHGSDTPPATDSHVVVSSPGAEVKETLIDSTDANTLHSWTAPRFLRMLAIAGTSYMALQMWSRPEADKAYVLEFDLKKPHDEGASGMEVDVTIEYYLEHADATNAATRVTSQTIRFFAPAAWTTCSLPFYMPPDRRKIRVQWMANTSVAADDGFSISNIQLRPART